MCAPKRIFVSSNRVFSDIGAILLVLLAFISIAQAGQQRKAEQEITAFQPGESLNYDISWSNMMRAGTAVMEVRSETLTDGRNVLQFLLTSQSEGALDRLYKLGDSIQSVFDPEKLRSLSYSSQAKHGKKTRRLQLLFDYEQKQATVRLNDDPPAIVPIPDQVQDPLTMLYYVRTRQDFSKDRPIFFKAFESDKVSDIEVQMLGREDVKTPAGAFHTIKVRVFRGFFTGEGEVFIWLTDDARKIPVLIKSKVSIGSLVFTLTGMKL